MNRASSGAHKPKTAGKELVVDFPDATVFQTVAGDRDESVKALEKKLDISIGRTPTSLIIRGHDSEVELAADLFIQMRDVVAKGVTIWPGDLDRALNMLSQNRRARLDDLYREQVKIPGRKYPVIPKTLKQKEYIDASQRNTLVFGVGPAGTGKTYLAMAMAVAALMNKDVKRVVLCRPAVEAGERLGFLPGDMAEKVNPYLRPLYDALGDMVDEKSKELIEKGAVEVAPLAFMRGRTLSHSFVILDEAQNTTPMQMKMFLTRLGFGSRCIVTGDITQIDLPRGQPSGLIDALHTLSGVEGIETIHFAEADVVRHPLVQRIVEAYKVKESGEK